MLGRRPDMCGILLGRLASEREGIPAQRPAEDVVFLDKVLAKEEGEHLGLRMRWIPGAFCIEVNSCRGVPDVSFYGGLVVGWCHGRELSAAAGSQAAGLSQL
jgi:hypothetical protein